DRGVSKGRASFRDRQTCYTNVASVGTTVEVFSRNAMGIGTALLALAFLLSSSGDTGQQLALKIVPNVAVAPADLRIRAEIAPDAANRLLEVVADSPQYYRSSQFQLNGKGAPRVTIVQLHDVPGGDYQITATVRKANGHLTVVQRHVVVVSPALNHEGLSR